MIKILGQRNEGSGLNMIYCDILGCCKLDNNGCKIEVAAAYY